MFFAIILLIAVSLQLCMIQSYVPRKNQNNRIFWIIGLQLSFIFGFRHLLVLPDTLGYYYHFNDVTQSSIFSIDKSDRFEIGYLVFEKFFHNYISSDFLVYNIFTTGFILFSSMYFFKRHSPRMWICVLLFIASKILYSDLIALRQGISIGIILLSFRYIEEKRKVKSIICILFACSFHSSALIMMFVAFLYWFRNTQKKKMLYLMICSTVIIFVSFQSLLVFHYGVDSDSNYLRSATETGFFNLVGIFNTIISIGLMWYIRKQRQILDEVSITPLYLTSIFFVLVSILSIRLFVISRYLLYLYPFTILYISQLYDKSSNLQSAKYYMKLLISFMVINYVYILYTKPEWTFYQNFRFWSYDISSYPSL